MAVVVETSSVAAVVTLYSAETSLTAVVASLAAVGTSLAVAVETSWAAVAETSYLVAAETSLAVAVVASYLAVVTSWAAAVTSFEAAVLSLVVAVASLDWRSVPCLAAAASWTVLETFLVPGSSLQTSALGIQADQNLDYFPYYQDLNSCVHPDQVGSVQCLLLPCDFQGLVIKH